MEYLLLGLLGIAMVVGSLVGFFSMFTKGDLKARLRELEGDLAHLKTRINTLEKDTSPKQKNNDVAPIKVAALKENIPTASIPTITKNTQPQDKNLDAPADTKATITSTKEGTSNEKKIVRDYAPIKPIEPNFVEKAINHGIGYAKDWLFSGNTLVRSGIVILFIGVGFLLKFASDQNFIPIELRLTGVALLGVGLLAFGWKQRDKRKEYSWALQGGGIGVLYLTTFAAMKLYHLIPAGAAFTLLIAIAFLSALIAVLQSALPLAILGFAGGFLAPIFTSTGGGSHTGLFSYYLVLNLAIAFIAFHKSWRLLNVLGFAFTFIIGTIWGAKNYLPEHFSTTEPFLIIHFLLFTLIAVLYAHRQATKASDYVDATLVFGTPIVGFSLQYALLKGSQFGLAYSALALGIFYIALAWWVLTRKRETLQFLGECFLALGVGFATLTLPLALDGRWTSAAWAVEGVGLLWVGLRQHRNFPLFSGLALQLLGAAAFTFGWGLTGYSATTSQNMFLGVGFIALAGWACGALINHYRPEKLKLLTSFFALWGWLWWVSAGLTAVDEFLSPTKFMHASLAFIALTSLLLPLLANRLQWPKLAKLYVLLLPVMAIAMLSEIFTSHPFAGYGGYSWLFAIAVYAFLLIKDKMHTATLFRAPLLWIVAIIGAMEWQYQLSNFTGHAGVWHDIGWSVVPLALIAGVIYWQFVKKSLTSEADSKSALTWGWIACAPLVLFTIAWFMMMSLLSDGDAAPLPYIPLLNPLDIALAGALLLLIIWKRYIAQYLNISSKFTPIIISVMAFTLLNGILLRTLHHWAGTPFRWTAIFDSSLVQMAFTFLWAITAFILMLLAHKRGRRTLWIIGAALMGLVVAKIFLLDMAQSGTIERIVSFIGAGLMLLMMGYFAPLPPAQLSTELDTDLPETEVEESS